MKVNFGDMTVRQIYQLCSSNHRGCGQCVKCPLHGVCRDPRDYTTYKVLEAEIDLPDEEVEEDE